MNKQAIILSITLIAGMVIGYYSTHYINRSMRLSSTTKIANSECALRRTMDKLWMEHAFFTRQFIIAATAELEDVELTAQRLFKNQDEIGDAIIPFYGEEAGKALAQLLREHISIAADIVKTAKAQDAEKVNSLNTQWQANAVDIATFLNSANPYFDTKALIAMLNEHLNLTTQELMFRLKSDWEADIENYDLIIEQIRMMGQGFADGIIKQFPNKF